MNITNNVRSNTRVANELSLYVRKPMIVAIVRADIEASDIYLVRHKTIMNTNTGYNNVKIKSCVINKAIPKI